MHEPVGQGALPTPHARVDAKRQRPGERVVVAGAVGRGLPAVCLDGAAEFERQLGELAYFFFSSRRRHTRLTCDLSSDVCSSDLEITDFSPAGLAERLQFTRDTI